MAKNQVVPAKSAKAVASALQGGDTSTTVVPVNRAIALPNGMKIKRMVTVPSLNLKVGQAKCLRIDSEIRISKVVDKSEAGKKREPANICDVTDVETGEQFIYLVSKVVQSNLERDYPEASYVGKVFYIQNLGKRNDSQRYFDFGIAEVEAE